MAQLAIKGHTTRGKEVIEILKMLGGNNQHDYIANCESLYFYIGRETNYIYYDWLNFSKNSDVVIFTLEEFLEKFPYKIGDRVRVAYYESEVRIDSMSWDGCEIQYQVFTDETEWYSAEELNKYNEIIKKETMDNGIIFDEIDFNRYPHADKVQLILGDDYEIKVEDGKTYVVKKQQKYPKTYDECCKVLQMPKDESYIDIDVPLSYNKVLKIFTQLLICRDAYWKISGNWKPEYSNGCATKYIITAAENKNFMDVSEVFNYVLIFPTEEMRDAFYENFTDLIEQCKELL